MTDADGKVPGPARHDFEDLDKLLAAVARREDGAFKQVFTKLACPVYHVAMAVLRDHAQAEEVAQEVLTEIWRTAGRFDPGKGSAMAWALMITRRRAIDRIRSITAGTSREHRTVTGTVAWDQVSEAVLDGLDRTQLRQCLDALSDPQRHAIMLVYSSGYTVAQAALVLDVPIGTVKSRIRAALINLRRGMQPGP